MQGISHSHQRPLCIVMEQNMTHNIVQHSWERSKKKGTTTTKMFSGSLQNLGMMGETSI
jgi:hypothetical protein